jgi:hypothetical protein
MARRKGAGKAMFAADNGHLHNLIYRKLSSIPSIMSSANTVTGLTVAVVFGGLPLLLWNYAPQSNWLFIYCLLWLLYAVLWGLFADRQTRTIEFSQPVSTENL